MVKMSFKMENLASIWSVAITWMFKPKNNNQMQLTLVLGKEHALNCFLEPFESKNYLIGTFDQHAICTPVLIMVLTQLIFVIIIIQLYRMTWRNGIKNIVLLYNKILERNPYLVQSVQTSTLLAVGDCAAQKLVEDNKHPYDYYRTARFALVGVIAGPALMAWYQFMEKIVGKDQSYKSSLTKVALDQIVIAPIFLAAFMGIHDLLQRKSFKEFKENLNENYRDILINNYKLWPAVQLINFSLVPIQYRVLIVQIIALGWNTYLAWKLHGGRPTYSNS